MIHLRGLAAVGALALVPISALADSPNLAGKTVTVFVGNAAGGGYDLYGRQLGRFFGDHLPGKPRVVVSNMIGAGTLKAANHLYSIAPKDGTAIGIVTEMLALEQASANPAVQYDAAKFNWVGRMAPNLAIHFQWHTSKVQSIEDAKKLPTAVAAAGQGNLSETIPMLLNEVIGTKFNIIRGYPGVSEGMIAMERGEVEGTVSSWAAININKSAWLKEKKIAIILQDLPTRSRELPDVPALGELADNPADRDLLNLYAASGPIGRAFLAPPDMEPEVVEMLQTAFDRMAVDPAYIQGMKDANLEADPMNGKELRKIVLQSLNVPQSVKDRARKIFGR